MYVPAWPVLSPLMLLPQRQKTPQRFPFDREGANAFYLARGAFYHLIQPLAQRGDTCVLMPDYHHGVEVAAIRAAGARVAFYRVDRHLQPDLGDVERLASQGAHVLVAIHYLGWPQPIRDMSAICRRWGMMLIEDCALALLSRQDGAPLGAAGDHAIFCLYKTLPLPHGGLLVENHPSAPPVEAEVRASCGPLSLTTRTVDLMLAWLRTRSAPLGSALVALERALGRLLTSLHVRRFAVGAGAFDLAPLRLGMSALCRNLVERCDLDLVVARRRANYRLLAEHLRGATPLFAGLHEGTCPLFFPILVDDKPAVSAALRRRGIETIEFWNDGDAAATGAQHSEALYLRRHVLGLPIHQDLDSQRIVHLAAETSRVLHGAS